MSHVLKVWALNAPSPTSDVRILATLGVDPGALGLESSYQIINFAFARDNRGLAHDPPLTTSLAGSEVTTICLQKT